MRHNLNCLSPVRYNSRRISRIGLNETQSVWPLTGEKQFRSFLTISQYEKQRALSITGEKRFLLFLRNRTI